MEKQVRKRHPARRGKRWLAFLMSLCLIGTMIPVTARAEKSSPEIGLCEHHTEHTAECGYVAPTEGHECGHVHDENCGYQEAGECTHVHTSECGYVEASEGSPCTYICKICAVQVLIDSLPDAADITEENYDDVSDMLGEIDTAKEALTAEESETLDFTKYDAAVVKMMELMGQAGAGGAATMSIDSFGITGTKPADIPVKTINLNATVLRPSSDYGAKWDGAQGNLVYFGNYNDNPVVFRVLASPNTQSVSDSKGGLLLDCHSTLERIKFSNDRNNNNWGESYLKEWLNEEMCVFSSVEDSALANTILEDRDDYTVGNYTYYDFRDTGKVFLLSVEEAQNLYANNSDREKEGSDRYWWLRSGSTFYDIKTVGCYSSTIGAFNYYSPDLVLGVSPAFNMSLTSVLFASASVESEASGAFSKLSALASVGDGSSMKSWKLTLLDSSKTVNITNEQSVTRQDTTITVPYTFTDSNADNPVSQISVMITDKAYTESDAQVLYYGALQNTTITDGGASGTGTFTLPADLTDKICGTDYYAYIIAEDVNGEKETDYASAPVQITIPVNPDTIKITYYDGETSKQVLVEHVPTDTIVQLKEKIATATGIGAANQQLIFAGQILAETESDGMTPRTLQDYSIQKNSTITLNQIVRQANVTINMPKGGQELNTDASCTTTGIENATLKWTDTTNNPVSGIANYYPWCYKAHVTVTPKTGYVLTNDTEVFVNGNGMEEKTLNADGTLTVASSFDSNKDKLTGITAPSPITVANGTAKTADALGLPSQIDITTEEGAVSKADVTWDLNNLYSGSYDPAKKTAQIFEVKGTISYPDEVEVPAEFDDRTVIIKVTVSAAKLPVTITGRNAELDFTAGMQINVSDYFTIDENAGTATYSLLAGPSSGEGTLTGTTLTINSVGVFNVYCTTAATDYYESGTANAILTVKESIVSGYTITATAGANGSITPSGAVKVAAGGSQTFTISPSSGYVIDTLKVDGLEVTATTSYTFNDVNANHTIEVSFKQESQTPDVPGVTAPSISTQPGNATVKVGETATFTIAASGDNLTYQWKINRNDGNGWVNITGANAASYTTSTVDKSCNGFQYKCVVSNSAGNVESNSATLTVQDAGGSDNPDTPNNTYQIIDGANSSWTHDSDGNITIRGNGDFSKFTGVKVDGNLIDQSNYTAKEGSTIITLKASYLNTLSAGTHTVEILWTDGSASTTFTIKANTSDNSNNNQNDNNNSDSSDDKPSSGTDKKDDVPKTGDNTPIVWLFILSILSGTGLIITVKKRRENLNS